MLEAIGRSYEGGAGHTKGFAEGQRRVPGPGRKVMQSIVPRLVGVQNYNEGQPVMRQA